MNIMNTELLLAKADELVPVLLECAGVDDRSATASEVTLAADAAGLIIGLSDAVRSLGAKVDDASIRYQKAVDERNRLRGALYRTAQLLRPLFDVSKLLEEWNQ